MTTCLFCGQPIATSWTLGFLFSLRAVEEPLACLHCRAEFQPIDPTTACPGCSRPQTAPTFCQDCEKWQTEYPNLHLKHHALFTYNDIAQAYLKRFKIQGDLVLAAFFQAEIRQFCATLPADTVIVPIPVRAASFTDRGFNQVEILLERAGLAYQPLLTHQGHQEKQARKNRAARLQSEQFFAWNDAEILSDQVTNILVVDDIYTTGRTLLHAKTLLHERGESELRPLTIKSFSLFR